MKDLIKKFSEDTGLPKQLAKKVIDLLYAKWLNSSDLRAVEREMREWIMKSKVQDLMKEMTDDDINAIIDDLIMDKMRMDIDCQRYSEGTMWLFSDMTNEKKEYKAGDTLDIQIMRTGKRDHSLYWEIVVDDTVLEWVIKNFKDNKRGIDLVVDENHEPDHKALALFKDLYKKGKDALFATIELTKKWAELLTDWAYRYFSPEIVFSKKDEESGEYITNLLTWGAFTNRPFFKAMDPIMANECVSDMAPNNQYLFIFQEKPMKKFTEILAQFSEKETITKEEKATLDAAFSELTDEQRKETRILTKYEMVASKFSEEEAAPADKEEAPETKTENKKEDEKETEEDKETKPTLKEGEVVVQASELSAMQQKIDSLVKENRLKDTTAKVNSMVFSEANKNSVLLPKSAQSIIDFAVSLSETQASKFLNIIAEFKDVSELIKEIGSSSTETVQTYNEEAHLEEVDALVKGGMEFKEAFKKALRKYKVE